jgi:hypothetical protein
MVSAIVAVFTVLPEVPLIVTVDTPAEAVDPAVNVTVPLPVLDAGPNDAVTPAGSPAAERVAFPVKPFCAVTVIVALALVFIAMLRLAGDAVSE